VGGGGWGGAEVEEEASWRLLYRGGNKARPGRSLAAAAQLRTSWSGLVAVPANRGHVPLPWLTRICGLSRTVQQVVLNYLCCSQKLDMGFEKLNDHKTSIDSIVLLEHQTNCKKEACLVWIV
jgi:hypothetical protein